MIDTEITANCLRAVLRPIISFCVNRSVGIQLFLEISKELFISVASQELSDSAANTSRLSIMTGINRREIDRFKKGDKKSNIVSSLKTKLIGQWQNDRRFSAKNGEPKKLLLESGQGSFVDLIATVSKELNSYTVLKEFERLKIVTREGSYIELNKNAYIANESIVDACDLVAADFSDLLVVAKRNTEKKSKVPDLHLSTRYDNICLESIDDIKQWLLAQGAEFHRRARDYLSQYDKDLNPNLWEKEGGAKVTIGTFGCTGVDKDIRL